MDIRLDLRKPLGQNASTYFDQAKKLRKKMEGAQETILSAEKKLTQVEKKLAQEEIVQQEKEQQKQRKKEWYEKFRWFYTSTGKLVIGGRDATTNEIVIKKHTSPEDVVMHTDMAGSPFFVLKDGKDASKAELKEVADATCTFSRAWKLGLQSQEVFYVKPEQVSKEARPGEHLAKGAFMIYGKTTYVENKVNLAIGLKEEVLMSGPLEAVKKHCKDYVQLVQGKEKVSAVAKKIQKKLGGHVDDIIRLLPSGDFALKRS